MGQSVTQDAQNVVKETEAAAKAENSEQEAENKAIAEARVVTESKRKVALAKAAETSAMSKISQKSSKERHKERALEIQLVTAKEELTEAQEDAAAWQGKVKEAQKRREQYENA